MKLAGAVLVFSAFSALAQPWPQEPTTVFGVELGAHLADLNLPRCNEPSHPKWGESVCIFSSTYARGAMVHELRSLPDLPFQYEAFLFEHGEVVSSITLKVAAEDWPALKATLIERYGPPMSITAGHAANLGGAVLPSDQLDWIGERTRVSATQRGLDMWTSSVVIEDRRTQARIAEQERRRIKDAAPGL